MSPRLLLHAGYQLTIRDPYLHLADGFTLSLYYKNYYKNYFIVRTG